MGIILFDRLARAAPIQGRRGGFRGWGATGFRRWAPGWIPAEFRSPAGIHLRDPARPLILRIFQASKGGLRPGWTPKKIALTLAKSRASPPRIQSRTGGTRSISMGYEVKHFGRRQFFLENGHRMQCFSRLRRPLFASSHIRVHTRELQNGSSSHIRNRN
jgi:hypothetical protein